MIQLIYTYLQKIKINFAKQSLQERHNRLYRALCTGNLLIQFAMQNVPQNGNISSKVVSLHQDPTFTVQSVNIAKCTVHSAQCSVYARCTRQIRSLYYLRGHLVTLTPSLLPPLGYDVKCMYACTVKFINDTAQTMATRSASPL